MSAASELTALLAAHAAAADPAGLPARAARAALLALVQERRPTTNTERLAVAAVLVTGDLPAEVEAAQALALACTKEPAARPLAARAFDRLRLLAGQPQKYGTEVVVQDGVRTLWPVDPNTTDSERAKWGLPALAELKRRAQKP